MKIVHRAWGALALLAALTGSTVCGVGKPSPDTSLITPAPEGGAAMAWSQPVIPVVADAPVSIPDATLPPVETAASRTARLLAGLDAQAQWLDQAETAGLARHARRTDADFEYFGRRVGEPMEQWAAQTLAHEDGETIFYPFSGPDLVTAHRLYPRAGRYVLVAMQKAGPPPDLAELPQQERRTTVELHQQIMHNFTRLGFFVTKEMNERFHRELPTAGLTGTLMAFAEREGYAVVDVEPVTLDDQGEVVPHDGERARAATWDSVRLHLRRRADGHAVTVDYVRLNLADWSLNKHEARRRFVDQMSGHRTLLKAASHLLQQRHGFSTVRDALLANAPSILQDETGLPYDRLAEDHQVHLYGEYEAPHRLFDADPQQPLAEAYAADPGAVADLPFRIGYRKRAGSCLQYAQRAPEPS